MPNFPSSALTQSSTPINPLPPFPLLIYSLFTLLLMWNAPAKVILFFVVLSIPFNYFAVHPTTRALYLTTATAHAFMAFIKLPEYNFDFSNSFYLLKYSPFTLPFICLSITVTVCKIPKYMYPFSFYSLITSPSGNSIPTDLPLTPFLITNIPHLSSPKSFE